MLRDVLCSSSLDHVMGFGWSWDQYQCGTETWRAWTGITLNTGLICFYYTPLKRLCFVFSLFFTDFFPLKSSSWLLGLPLPSLSILYPSLPCSICLCQAWGKCYLWKQDSRSSLSTISSLYSVCMRVCICRCVYVWTAIHIPVLSTEGLRGCGQQKLVPLESPLLALNNTNRDFLSSLSPSLRYIYSLMLKFSSSLSSLTHLLICSPAIFSCLYPFPVSVYGSPSLHPPVPPSFLLSSPDG